MIKINAGLYFWINSLKIGDGFELDHVPFELTIAVVRDLAILVGRKVLAVERVSTSKGRPREKRLRYTKVKEIC